MDGETPMTYEFDVGKPARHEYRITASKSALNTRWLVLMSKGQDERDATTNSGYTLSLLPG